MSSAGGGDEAGHGQAALLGVNAELQALPSPNEAKLVAEIQQLENKLEEKKLLLAQVRSASGSGSDNPFKGVDSVDLPDKIPSDNPFKGNSSRQTTCNWCGSEGSKLLRCSACKKVAYCGKDCQKAAWKFHKPECVLALKEKKKKEKKDKEEEEDDDEEKEDNDYFAMQRKRLKGHPRDEQGNVIVERDETTGLLLDRLCHEFCDSQMEWMPLSNFHGALYYVKEHVPSFPQSIQVLVASYIGEPKEWKGTSQDLDEGDRMLQGILDRAIHKRESPFPQEYECDFCSYPAVFNGRCACEYCTCMYFGKGECMCNAYGRIREACEVDAYEYDFMIEDIVWEYRFRGSWDRFPHEVEQMCERLLQLGSPHVLYNPDDPSAEGKYESIRSLVPPPGVATHRITFEDMMVRDMYRGRVRWLAGANPVRRKGPYPQFMMGDPGWEHPRLGYEPQHDELFKELIEEDRAAEREYRERIDYEPSWR